MARARGSRGQAALAPGVACGPRARARLLWRARLRARAHASGGGPFRRIKRRERPDAARSSAGSASSTRVLGNTWPDIVQTVLEGHTYLKKVGPPACAHPKVGARPEHPRRPWPRAPRHADDASRRSRQGPRRAPAAPGHGAGRGWGVASVSPTLSLSRLFILCHVCC